MHDSALLCWQNLNEKFLLPRDQNPKSASVSYGFYWKIGKTSHIIKCSDFLTEYTMAKTGTVHILKNPPSDYKIASEKQVAPAGKISRRKRVLSHFFIETNYGQNEQN